MSDDNKPDDSGDDTGLRPEGLRALQAERDANKDLRAQLKDLQEKWDAAEAEKLTSEQAAVKRAEEAEAELNQLRETAARDKLLAKVSQETGVPTRLLTGKDETELLASAEEAKDFAKSFSGPRRPAPDPTQGSGSNNQPTGDREAEALDILGFSE